MQARPSRRYVKRVWRVPKDRGPVECFATLLVKALVKHGWPATWANAHLPGVPAFLIEQQKGPPVGPDFWEAVEIASRVVARQAGVEIVQHKGFVELAWDYQVNERGEFRKVRE